MASFNYADAEKYGGQGGGGYFALKDDGDVAKVRFMYDSLEDMEGYAVHEADVGDKKRYVNCLRSYEDPIDKCPFCKAQKKVIPKLFIPIYNISEDRCEIWDRGKAYFAKLGGLFNRYAQDKPLCANIFEIERHGKKGDQKTDYQFFQISCDGTVMEDLPELPQMLGGLILDKTYEEMQTYLDKGSFPNDDDDNSQSPVRRRYSEDTNDAPVSRRTPSSESGERRRFS